jgi:hypothetical protein
MVSLASAIHILRCRLPPVRSGRSREKSIEQERSPYRLPDPGRIQSTGAGLKQDSCTQQ